MSDELELEYGRVLAKAAAVGDMPESQSSFWAFVWLRHKAWHRKAVDGAARPWSFDPLLNEFRFTNIYRELDRGTLFTVTECLERVHSRSDAAVIAAAYRSFNRIDTWQDLVTYFRRRLDDPNMPVADVHANIADDFSGNRAGGWTYDFFQLKQAEGAKVFTGAYMMTSMAKLFHERRLHELAAAAKRAIIEPDTKGATERLAECPYLGGFSAFQVAMDMAIPVLANGGRPWHAGGDLDSYVAIGPGSRAGGRAVRPDLPPIVTMRFLREQQYESLMRVGDGSFPYPSINGRHIGMRMIDIEHALCEYAKYVNALNGGRMKSRLSTPAVGASWVPKYVAPPAWGKQT